MTIQNTFYTAENTKNWYLVELDEGLLNGITAHPILQWKIQGIDAPAIPVTVNGGPTLMTRSTDWFIWNSETGHLYGMDRSGCWAKGQGFLYNNIQLVKDYVKKSFEVRASSTSIASIDYELQEPKEN